MKKFLVLILVLFTSQNIFAQSGWQNTFSFPGRVNNFKDIYLKDSLNIIALENKGRVFMSSDRGINWQLIFEDSTYTFNFMRFADGNTGCIFSANGKILKTTNFGNNWTLVLNKPWATFNDACFTNNNTCLAFGPPYYFLKSTNSGLSWDSIPCDNYLDPVGNFIKSQFFGNNTGFIMGNQSVYIHGGIHPGHMHYTSLVLKTINSGLNWSTIYSISFIDQNILYSQMNFFNQQTGWIFTNTGIIKTTNSGGNWLYASSLSSSVKSLEMINEINGWLGTSNGEIHKTTDAGLTWFLQFQNSNLSVSAIKAIDNNSAWFCGSNNSIYKTTNGGGVISGVFQTSSNIPEQFSLKQNYPNPFNPSTKINYEIKSSGFVSLKVFDLLGKEVAALVNEKQNPGSYAVDFNSTEFNLPSGIYFYSLSAEDFKETKKMVLVK